jgi:hypothetical protein
VARQPPVAPPLKIDLDAFDASRQVVRLDGPVEAEFLRRQRRDAAAIPVRVWLTILDQGIRSLR